MKKSIGELLSFHRRKAGMTQAQVCKEVNTALHPAGEGLTQATLSAWERGYQRPSTSHILYVRAIGGILNIDSLLLDEAMSEPNTLSEVTPDGRYAADVRDWVKTVLPGSRKNKPSRIWFLAPHALPALLDRSETTASLWVDNLQAGVDHNLLWVLEDVDECTVFEKFLRFVQNLNARCAESLALGAIHLYLIRRSSNTLTVAQCLAEQSFMEFAAKQTTDGARLRVTWKYLHQPLDDRFVQHIHRLLDFWSLYGEDCLIVHVPSETSGVATIEACLFLAGTRPTLHGPVQNCYCWFPRHHARGLEQFIAFLETWLRLQERTE